MKPRIVERKTLAEGKYLKFESLKIDADTVNYEVFSRPGGQDGVNVLALTDKNELLLVEEYRPAVDAYVLSLVAGVIDPQTSVEENARRELLEETGYASDETYNLGAPIGGISLAPGVWPERAQAVLIRNCKKVARGGGKASEQENIRTHLVPVKELEKFMEKAASAGKVFFFIHTMLGILRLHHPVLWREIFE